MSKHHGNITPMDISDAAIERADMTIAKTVAEKLYKHYPGHQWLVSASVTQGIVQIFNAQLSMKESYNINMIDLERDPKLKIVMRAGGEILERWALKRSKLTMDIREIINHRPTDFRGDLLHE
jgi:hypothetical protein